MSDDFDEGLNLWLVGRMKMGRVSEKHRKILFQLVRWTKRSRVSETAEQNHRSTVVTEVDMEGMQIDNGPFYCDDHSYFRTIDD